MRANNIKTCMYLEEKDEMEVGLVREQSDRLKEDETAEATIIGIFEIFRED